METKSLLKTMAASAFCVATFLFAACDKDKDKPVLNKLTFDKTTIEVTEGKTADLKVKNGTAPFRVEISGKNGEEAGVGKSHRVIESIDNAMGINLRCRYCFAETLPIRQSDVGTEKV